MFGFAPVLIIGAILGMEIDLSNSIFLICALAGGVLLLISVLLDDVLGGLLDFIHLDVDIGGSSIMPVALGFIAMFGVGGLIGTQTFGLSSGPAAGVGVLVGALGGGAVAGMFRFLRTAEAGPAFSRNDLVGAIGRVSVDIDANRSGAIYVSFGGNNYNYTATSSQAISAGTIVKVIAVVASTLVVMPDETTSQPDPNNIE